MENQKVRKLVLSALMAALVYVATSIIQIPSPVNGYVNLGDCFVLLSGWLLGPWYGAAAAGIGSMLVDLLSGYGHYVPGTLIIKGLDALAAALIFRALGRGKTAMLVSGIVGETIMVLGYFFYNGMNMTHLESRPLKGRPFEYFFHIDVLGNLRNPATTRVLHNLAEHCNYFKILGNYVSDQGGNVDEIRRHRG